MRNFLKFATSFIIIIIIIYLLEPGLELDGFTKRANNYIKPGFKETVSLEDKGNELNFKHCTQEDAASGKKDSRHVISDEYFIAPDRIESIQKLSLSSKLTGLAILSRLGEKNRNRVLDIYKEGITYAELEELKSIIAESLNSEEIKKLEKIVAEINKIAAVSIKQASSLIFFNSFSSTNL